MRRFRALLLIAVFVAVTPIVLLTGYGLYHGFDVVSGVPRIVRMTLGTDVLIRDAVQPVSADALHSRRGEVVWTGELENEELSEASGLAVGRRNDVLFSINDSGHDPRLFALTRDGQDIGSWPIAFDGWHDFEDMASFVWQGRDYLLIADTGDNFYWRPALRLILLAEPDLASLKPGAVLPVERIIEFSFADGQRDIEAVAVDPDSEEILLVSKRHMPPELFTLPLVPASSPAVARPVARVTGIPEPSARDLREDPENGQYRSMPTALDVDGRRALIVTYRDAYLFSRRRSESWAQAMSAVPLRIPLPDIYGLESGAIRDSTIFVTGEREDERGRMGLYRVDL